MRPVENNPSASGESAYAAAAARFARGGSPSAPAHAEADAAATGINPRTKRRSARRTLPNVTIERIPDSNSAGDAGAAPPVPALRQPEKNSVKKSRIRGGKGARSAPASPPPEKRCRAPIRYTIPKSVAAMPTGWALTNSRTGC